MSSVIGKRATSHPPSKREMPAQLSSLPAQKFTNVEIITFQTKSFWYLLPIECLTQNYSIIAILFSLLLFCTSDPAAAAFSPPEWCLFVPYLQLQQAQVYIYELEIYFPPEFGHSKVLDSFWAPCSQWCQGPPVIGSDTGNEEWGGGRAWSQHVLICLLIGDKLEFESSFNHSC